MVELIGMAWLIARTVQSVSDTASIFMVIMKMMMEEVDLQTTHQNVKVFRAILF